jgi:hypothetical protein
VDLVNIVVITKSLAAANVEEYTDNYTYDMNRDSIHIQIEEKYAKQIKQRLFDLEYDLIFSKYLQDIDEVILVFTRL